MSETTRNMREFRHSVRGDVVISCGDLQDLRDLTADAIEAVEAQVAEAVARVAALEMRQGKDGAQVASSGCASVPVAVAPESTASPAAPTAVPAPRGFRVGDRVRITKARDCSRDWIGCEGRIVAECNDSLLGDWRIGDLSKFKYIRTVPMFGENLTLVRAADAPEAPAEEDTGLVVQRIRDEATKPLHVEIEKLRGEVARLTKERDEARAIPAATAERVRNETQIATELRKDLADARDRIASKDRSIEVMLAETRALREALDAERSGVATKLHDAGFNNVENLVGAYRFERAQADALRAKLAAAESDRDAAFSKETALRRDLLAWQDAAMEARGERDEFKRRLAAADREQERLRAELAALKAKPRSRTRPVTAADLDELEREYNKADYKANEEFRAASALGFRRRVDGAK